MSNSPHINLYYPQLLDQGIEPKHYEGLTKSFPVNIYIHGDDDTILLVLKGFPKKVLFSLSPGSRQLATMGRVKVKGKEGIAFPTGSVNPAAIKTVFEWLLKGLVKGEVAQKPKVVSMVSFEAAIDWWKTAEFLEMENVFVDVQYYLTKYMTQKCLTESQLAYAINSLSETGWMLDFVLTLQAVHERDNSPAHVPITAWVEKYAPELYLNLVAAKVSADIPGAQKELEDILKAEQEAQKKSEKAKEAHQKLVTQNTARLRQKEEKEQKFWADLDEIRAGTKPLLEKHRKFLLSKS